MTRRTLATPVTLHGNAVRLHGADVSLVLAPGDEGFVFVRTDTGQRYPALLEQVVAAPNTTALGRAGRPEVLFVEHVLSALVGLGYTDAEILVDGPEVPLFDGSALPLVAALAEAGSVELAGGLEPLVVRETLTVERDGRRLTLSPGDWSLIYEFSHPHPLIGADRCELTSLAEYAREVAPARTFATAEELAALAAAGLIRGGSEANLLVVHPDRLSSPLRLPHEFAAHKALDLIGDLALVGRPVVGRFTASRTGHADNQALAAALLASQT